MKILTNLFAIGALALSSYTMAETTNLNHQKMMSVSEPMQNHTKKVTVHKKSSTKKPSTMVNINTATAKELQQLNGIGESKANAIITYRKKNGSFTSIEQLKEVKGIGDELLNKNKAYLTY